MFSDLIAQGKKKKNFYHAVTQLTYLKLQVVYYQNFFVLE
jgi:hypothetical protein